MKETEEHHDEQIGEQIDVYKDARSLVQHVTEGNWAEADEEQAGEFQQRAERVGH